MYIGFGSWVLTLKIRKRFHDYQTYGVYCLLVLPDDVGTWQTPKSFINNTLSHIWEEQNTPLKWISTLITPSIHSVLYTQRNVTVSYNRDIESIRHRSGYVTPW